MRLHRSREDAEAVSPVVATLLLVAITVVLTATVMVLANGFGDKSSQVAPVVVPSRDEANDRLVVLRADAALPLSRLLIEMSVPGHFAYNALASSSTTALAANTLVSLGATGNVMGGDTIYFCSNSPGSDVRVLLQDPISNKIVASETFVNLAQCA
jgi:flagellin-like protein